MKHREGVPEVSRPPAPETRTGQWAAVQEASGLGHLPAWCLAQRHFELDDPDQGHRRMERRPLPNSFGDKGALPVSNPAALMHECGRSLYRCRSRFRLGLSRDEAVQIYSRLISSSLNDNRALSVTADPRRSSADDCPRIESSTGTRRTPGNFVDTNVLVYLAFGDPAKADRAERIAAAGGRVAGGDIAGATAGALDFSRRAVRGGRGRHAGAERRFG